MTHAPSNGASRARLASGRIEALLEEIRDGAPPEARARVEELVGTIVSLYGEGLARLVEMLDGTDPDPARARRRLLDDPLLASLLILHDLHPVPLAERVALALEKVRPLLGSHAGGVKLVGIDEERIVHLRLEGSCEGCPSSLVTVKLAIERAIDECAPDVAGVDVEGLVDSGGAVHGRTAPISDPSLPMVGAATNGSGRPGATDGARANGSPRGAAPLAGVGGRVREEASEACELCSVPIGPDHGHLVDVETRRLQCACRACHLLFTHEGASGGGRRAVPTRYLRDDAFALTDALWDRLQVPVRTAFFFYNSAERRHVAFYPSPAGATESLLGLEAWEELASAHPLVRRMAPDVEALLVHGHAGGGFESYLVPIEACYELVGHVRRRWKGFHGGDEAWREIEAFFGGVRARSRPLAAAPS